MQYKTYKESLFRKEFIQSFTKYLKFYNFLSQKHIFYDISKAIALMKKLYINFIQKKGHGNRSRFLLCQNSTQPFRIQWSNKNITKRLKSVTYSFGLIAFKIKFRPFHIDWCKTNPFLTSPYNRGQVSSYQRNSQRSFRPVQCGEHIGCGLQKTILSAKGFGVQTLLPLRKIICFDNEVVFD